MQPPRTSQPESRIARFAPTGPARHQKAGYRLLEAVPAELRAPLCDYFQLRARGDDSARAIVAQLRGRLASDLAGDGGILQDRRDALRALALALRAYEHDALRLVGACGREES